MRNPYLIAAASAVLVASVNGLAAADPVSEFYNGRTARMIVSTTVGGSYDTTARLITRHVYRHIPGTPNFVVQNMVGASGRLAANYMANVAPRDGSVLFAAMETLAIAQLMDESGIQYDVRRFNWIGTPFVPVSLFIIWHTAGVRTLEDARTKEIVIGAAGSSGTTLMYPSLFNALLGTKFKIVTGYAGGNELDLAIEREEVHGRGAVIWHSLKTDKPDWIRDKKIVYFAQMTLEKHPELMDVPTFIDFADNANTRRVLELVTESSSFGRPIATAPEVPSDRVVALRKAFDETMRDEKFLAEVKQLQLEINPTSGEQMQKMASNLMSASAKDVEFIKAALHGRGVVPCETFSDAKNCMKSKNE